MELVLRDLQLFGALLRLIHTYVKIYVFVCLRPLPGYELSALYYPSWDGEGGRVEGDAVVADLWVLPQHTPGMTMETTKTTIKAADLALRIALFKTINLAIHYC